MKKKLLSLLLIACMVLPSLALLPLPQFTAFAAAAVPTAGTVTSFPGTSNANLPTVSGDKVTFHGNWMPFSFMQGQYSVDGVVPMDSLQNATIMPDAIMAEKTQSDLWLQYSCMNLKADNSNYRPNAGQLNVTAWRSAGIRYTAEASGTLKIVLDKVGNFGSTAHTGEKEDFRYAVYHNGKMIWPVVGGEIEETDPLASRSMTNVTVTTGIDVALGDTIDFVCEGFGLAETGEDAHGQGNAMHPTITYTAINNIHTSLALGLGDSLTVYGTLKFTETAATEAGITVNGVDYKGAKQSDGTWRVVGPAVNAKNAVDAMTVNAYYVKNGVRTTGKQINTSVATLLHAYTTSTDGAAMKYAELAAATLDYVSEAQSYFGYETGNLANGGSTTGTAVKGSYDADKLFVVTKLDGATVAPSEIALLLRDRVGIHVTLAALGGATVNMTGYKLQVADNASFNGASNIAVTESNGTYKAELLGISARLWNDSFFFRVVNASGTSVSSTFTYGVSAYYARMSENDGVASLVSSMMVLYEATQAKASGSTMNATNSAMIPTAKPATGTTTTASSFATAFTNGTLEAGKVYVVTDNAITLKLTDGATVDCNGAILVTTKNVVIRNGTGATLKNLTVFTDGKLDFKSFNDNTLENVEIVANGAITLQNTASLPSSAVSLYDCRFTSATGNALNNAAPTLTAYHCYFATTASGVSAIVDNGGNTLIEDSVIYANGGLAVEMTGNDNTIRYCTLRGGVSSPSAAENLLVGGCLFRGATDAITFTSAHNSAVVLNDVTAVTLTNGTSNYVVNNNIYGKLTLDNCNYLLVNNNNLHGNTVDMVSCANYNGDTVVDVTARKAYGVNEDLLPKVDDDVHINMTRKTTVRVPYGKEVDIAEYINTKMESGKTLIVAPGAYTVRLGAQSATGSLHDRYNRIFLEGLENADLYAYGVLYERQTYDSTSIDVHYCKNVSFYGLTLNMTVQSSGLVIVVQKLGNNQVKVLKGAGMKSMLTGTNDAGQAVTLADYYYWNNDHPSIYRKDQPYSYADIGGANKAVAFDANGFATFTYTQSTYDQIQVGDVITCRQSVSLTYLYRNESLLFEDVTILGGSVRCFWDDYAEKGTTLNRVIDKPMPSKVITEAEYNTYKGYESTYGIYTGVYIDESGNHRGTPSRTATADFAHSSSSRTGFTVTNSLVSGLSDDGTNNQGYKDRVAGYDAATGTLTLANDNGWGDGVPTNGYDNYPCSYDVGENVLIYTSTGKLIAKTTVSAVGDRFTDTDNSGNEGKFITVKIPVGAIASGALDGFDLDNAYSDAHKIYIHSLDRMGDDIFFDNVKFQNIRSRAALVKSDNATIKNCSFYNIGMAAIGMNFEIRYGESGYVNNATIQNNYFENTGYFNNYTYYSPISVDAPTVQGTDDYLLSSNVKIEGNVIRNRGTTNAIFLRGVNNATIKNNDFGLIKNTKSGVDVFGLFVNFVNLDGNTYSTGAASSATVFSGYRNVIGKDLILDEDPTMSTLLVDSYEESRPYLNTSKTLCFKGNWSAGYLPRTSFSYTQYAGMNATTYTAAYYMTQSDGADPWSGYGSIANITRDYRYMPSASYNSAFRYTAPQAGSITFSLSNFYTPYESTSAVGGSGDGQFAIFDKNGTMVWPTKGASYTSSSWYTITHDTSHAELNKSLSAITLTVAKGDTLYFVARRASSSVSSIFSAVPVVYYLAPQGVYVPVGNQTQPDKILGIF